MCYLIGGGNLVITPLLKLKFDTPRVDSFDKSHQVIGVVYFHFH